MNYRPITFIALLLLPCVPLGARIAKSSPPAPQSQDQTITVAGIILSAAGSVPKGRPNQWKVDLDDDMDSDLTLLNSGAELAGNELIQAGLMVEAVITPLDVEKEIYGLVRWVRVGLRR